MDNWSLNDWHYITMWLRATITFEMQLSVSPSHYNKFRYHTAVGAIKAALHGQKLKLLIWGIASTAGSACIEWRMLYKSPCKTALKAEMSLPAFSGMSEDDFHRSQSIALRDLSSLYFPQKVYFANHNNQLQCFINGRESSNRQRETLQSLPFIFTLGFCWDLWTACKSYTWIFQK